MTRITDLPDGVLEQVGSFLPQASAALFATALIAPSSSFRESYWLLQTSTTTRAILSSSKHANQDQYTVLDFADIEKDLAKRLTDDDLGAILVCIDAPNKLKRLKLTGLVNIVGHGLVPLCGSTKLEQIDLSLVKLYESLRLEPGPSISVEAVITVLNSIVEMNGNCLKQIQFPHIWKKIDNIMNTSAFVQLDQFLTRYNQLLDSRPFNCADCSTQEDCTGTDGRPWIRQDVLHDVQYRTNDLVLSQDFTCYKCLDNVCFGLAWGCDSCSRHFCDNCNPTEYCDDCGSCYCTTCKEFTKCTDCLQPLCSDCIKTCISCNTPLCDRCCTSTMYYLCEGCAEDNSTI